MSKICGTGIWRRACSAKRPSATGSDNKYELYREDADKFTSLFVSDCQPLGSFLFRLSIKQKKADLRRWIRSDGPE